MNQTKRYVLTGGTSGIGKETALALLKGGSFIYILARNEEKAKQIYEDFKDLVLIVPVDLYKPEEIEKTILSNITSKIDGSILCAGIEETLPIKMYNYHRLESLFKVNFFSNFELIRVLTSKKISKICSSHVVLSSIMSVNGQPGKTAYCASKSALIGLVKAAAIEMSMRKIRINAISPAVVNTPMTEKLFHQLSEENIEKIKAKHPLGLGDPSDISNLIEYLLSDKSRWITGQNYIIDGGYSIP
jgi:NAD(P)-dependent dehydrogenase (short-subunit alcohol dehydrogenase family)